MICDYCKGPAEQVTGEAIYPHRADLFDLKFFLCRPCGAFVGTHKATGEPLGRLANGKLRTLRKRVHAMFDPLWKRDLMSRGEAYRRLREGMGISADECHIAMFDEERCVKALEFLKESP